MILHKKVGGFAECEAVLDGGREREAHCGPSEADWKVVEVAVVKGETQLTVSYTLLVSDNCNDA